MRTSLEDALHMNVTLTTLHHEDFPWRCPLHDSRSDGIASWRLPMKMPSIWQSLWRHCIMRTSHEDALHRTVTLPTLHHEDFPWRCPAHECHSDDIASWGLLMKMNSTWLSKWESSGGHLYRKSSWCNVYIKSSWCNVVRVTVIWRASSWEVLMMQCRQRDCHMEGIFMGSLHDAIPSERLSCRGRLHGNSSWCNVVRVTVLWLASSWEVLMVQCRQSDSLVAGIFMGSPHGAMSSEWHSCGGHLHGKSTYIYPL